jgi:hypothetical protein
MKSVAVLCFGAHTDPWVFEALDASHADWAQHAFDVALNLKDPLEDDRVHHTQNGMHNKTMIAVMGQSKFVEATGTILDHVAAQADSTDGLLIPIYCKKGMHRSDVVSRFIAEALNEVEYQGEKLFNIQLFSLNESSCLRDKKHAVAQAIRWVTHGWEAPPMPTAKVRYGTVECRSRENASKNCGSAWAHVDYLQNYLNESMVTKSLDVSAVDAGNVGEPEDDQNVQQDSLPSGEQSSPSTLAPTAKMLAAKPKVPKRTFEATRHNKLNRISSHNYRSSAQNRFRKTVDRRKPMFRTIATHVISF